MIKTVLIVLLGIFFVLNGVNHLFNRKILEEYVEKRRLPAPRLAVLLSGILLNVGGIAIVIPAVRVPGIVALLVFMLTATFTIHRFWDETEKYERMMEGMNFAKNLAITTELVYLVLG